MQPTLDPVSSTPHLRLLDGRSSAAAAASALHAWILLFAALCASGGHGLFLACALTRLEKIPGRSELGGPLQIAVLAWFVGAAPLALLAAGLRGQLTRLGPRSLWIFATLTTLATGAAFAIYLRAIALA